MAVWHEVEALCPSCQTWQPSGATTTIENFESRDSHALGGRVPLPCGHLVDLDVHEVRLGSGVAAAEPKALPDLDEDS